MRSKYDDDIRKCLEYILRWVGGRKGLKYLLFTGTFVLRNLLLQLNCSLNLCSKGSIIVHIHMLKILVSILLIFDFAAKVRSETGLFSTSFARTATPTSSGDKFIVLIL